MGAVSICRRRPDSAAGRGHVSPGGGYLYPPFMALTALPFLALPASLSRFALVRCQWSLPDRHAPLGLAAGGRQPIGRLRGREYERASARPCSGCLCGFFYLQNCLAHQQTDIVIGAMLVGGCLLLVRGRILLAATAFGLAAACKCTALLWAPYLLWRGRPLAAVWLVLVALGVNLLPDLVGTYAKRTALAGRIRPALSRTAHRIRIITSALGQRRGLQSIARRSWVSAGVRPMEVDRNRLHDPEPRTLAPRSSSAPAFTACQAILFARRCCGVAVGPFRKIAEDHRRTKAALECGIVLLLMLLLSPMSSKAHFGTLIVPGFCLARAGSAPRAAAS